MYLHDRKSDLNVNVTCERRSQVEISSLAQCVDVQSCDKPSLGRKQVLNLQESKEVLGYQNTFGEYMGRDTSSPCVITVSHMCSSIAQLGVIMKSWLLLTTAPFPLFQSPA